MGLDPWNGVIPANSYALQSVLLLQGGDFERTPPLICFAGCMRKRVLGEGVRDGLNQISMHIYILRDGTKIGPFSEATARKLLDQRAVAPNDLAWHEGAEKWLPLGYLFDLPESQYDALATPAAERAQAAVGSASAESSGSVTSAGVLAHPGRGANGEDHHVHGSERPHSSDAHAEEAGANRATPRQKAFLAYMGVEFPSDITREGAALLVNDLLERSSDPAKISRWNEDRLRLHPDLFEQEIEERKANRPARFYAYALKHAGDHFDGLTKAHAQVLIGYLDMKFPGWETNEQEGAWNYFFPAIAEKFPDVVRKQYRDKLSYPKGPRSLAGRKSEKLAGKNRKVSPAIAILKGALAGAFASALLAASLYFANRPSPVARANPAPAPQGGEKLRATAEHATAPSSGASSVAQAAPADSSQAAPQAAKAAKTAELPIFAAEDDHPARTDAAAVKKESPATANAEDESGKMANAASPKAAVADAPKPSAPESTPVLASNVSLFGQPEPGKSVAKAEQPAGDAPAGTVADASSSSGNSTLDYLFPNANAAATPAPRRTSVTLTRPVDVTLQFGKARIPQGTQLRLVSKEGASVKVSYLNTVVQVPLGSTDLAAAP